MSSAGLQRARRARLTWSLRLVGRRSCEAEEREKQKALGVEHALPSFWLLSLERALVRAATSGNMDSHIYIPCILLLSHTQSHLRTPLRGDPRPSTVDNISNTELKTVNTPNVPRVLFSQLKRCENPNFYTKVRLGTRAPCHGSHDPMHPPAGQSALRLSLWRLGRAPVSTGRPGISRGTVASSSNPNTSVAKPVPEREQQPPAQAAHV